MKNENHASCKSKPDVSIMIINWNTNELLEQCLNSIISHTKGVSYDIVVTDNNSDGTGFERVKQLFSKYENITWVENNENIGIIADNYALPHCQGRHLLLLGPDTVVLPDCIKNMVDFLDNNNEAGAVTAKLLNPDGSPQNYYHKFWNLTKVFLHTFVGRAIDRFFFNHKFRRYYLGGDIDSSRITMVEQPCAACFMLRRKSIGTDYLIDPDFPFYFNDVDLCKRIYINGYKIFLLPSAEVKHFKSSSFIKSDRKWASREHRSSMIKYCKKYHKNKVLFLRLLLLLK